MGSTMLANAVAPTISRPVATSHNNESLEARARHSIENDSPYAFYFRFIRFSSRQGVLTVRGCLPSFYLKQVLISHIQKVDGVQQIDDQVDVISCNGLSSVPRRSVA